MNPVFAQEDDQELAKKYQELFKKYQELLKKFEAYARMLSITNQGEIARTQVKIKVHVPMREGRDDPRGGGSGTVIFEEENRIEDINGKITKYKTYYILSTDHVVGEINLLLKKYEEAGVRIFIRGKKDEVRAHIVAWEWGSTAILFRVDIPENELDNFNFKVAKIAEELPASVNDARYSDKEVDIIWLGGYPFGYPVVNPGYISTYLYDFNFASYTRLMKVAVVDVPGLSWRGSGQSGAGAFNQKGELVAIVIGRTLYQGASLTIVIPIDIIVERFLKELSKSELRAMDLPSFELEERIKYRKVYLDRPENVTIKQEDKDSKK